MNCTNCNLPSETEFCPTCEPLRARLAKLRAEQKQFWRDVKTGKRQLVHPKKRPAGGAHFLMQCQKHGPAMVAQRAEHQATALPLAGQDAALPVGDR